MKQSEYLKLVQESAVFNELDEDFQNRILNAEGEEKARYEHIFTTERNGILAAKKEMIDRNTQVVREFQMATKKTSRDFMKNAEARERTSESKKADELLDKI